MGALTRPAFNRSTSFCARSRCVFNCWTIPLKLGIVSPSGEHCNSPLTLCCWTDQDRRLTADQPWSF